MNQYFSNEQVELAERFILMNTLTNQSSYEAVLNIKRWKLISRISGMDKNLIQEAEVKINNTLFCYVSSSFLLEAENYYFGNVLN